jgi:DNA polymerase-3 subunit epsilon
MLDELNLAIVDLETTGGSAVSERIIEVGIKRIERGQAVRTFHTLVDPERPIPSIITQITGITDRDVAGAPTFARVQDQILEVLDGCVFVAHNVRFDYGFLRSEFQRQARRFCAPCLCTVRLSRMLYPRWRQHGLSHVIERFNLPCANRHRALDDAEAVWAFLQHASGTLAADRFTAALQALLQEPAVPPALARLVEALPDGPGVYVFRDGAGAALYVGRSTDVRERVRQHFVEPDAGVLRRVGEQLARIDAHPTYGELDTRLLELHLIDTLRPLHNRRGGGRRDAALRRRVLPWPFDGPVLIEERSAEGTRGHALVLDAWKLARATAYAEDGATEFLPPQGRFDLKRYRMFAAYFAGNPRGVRRLGFAIDRPRPAK